MERVFRNSILRAAAFGEQCTPIGAVCLRHVPVDGLLGVWTAWTLSGFLDAGRWCLLDDLNQGLEASGEGWGSL